MVDGAPTVIPAGLFQAIEALCREALSVGGNTHSSRVKVGAICNTLRLQSMGAYGHDSVEVIALVKLLRRTDPKNADKDRPAPRVDPVKELGYQNILNVSQLSAAAAINDVCLGWSRHLAVSGRSYDGSGGGKKKAVGPVEVMGERIWEVWINRFKPWREIAKRKLLATTNSADVTLKIVAEGYYPTEIAKRYDLDEDLVLKVLKRELNRFNNTSSGEVEN